MATLDPVTQAELALDQAELRRLVEAVAEHHTIGCRYPQSCVGEAVWHVVMHEVHGGQRARLLLLALVELRRLGYAGLPGYNLTDTGRAAIDGTPDG